MHRGCGGSQKIQDNFEAVDRVADTCTTLEDSQKQRNGLISSEN
jgi:hypothetical protein